MNRDKLKKNIGSRVKLVPPAHHLDQMGDLLPSKDEDWFVVNVTSDHVEINIPSGHFYRLGIDHIRSYSTDPHREADGLKHGFLQLHVQLFIQGNNARAVPNHQPGAPVAPPPVNPAARAQVTFAPELERIFRRQIQILDRVIANYGETSNARGPCPGDDWKSLKPWEPKLFPTAAAYRDLSAADTELLAEFYAAVSEVVDILSHWTEAVALTEYNAWNVLMHKVQQSVRLGELAVRKIFPNRRYDEASPASGTLLSQSRRVLQSADRARSLFITKYNEELGKHSPPPPLRRR